MDKIRKKGAWFWVGITLLSPCALWWLPPIISAEDKGDAVLAGVITTVIPIGVGTYGVWRASRALAGKVSAKEIASLRDARSVESLIKLLSHKDGSVRRHAAEALGEIGDISAAESLGQALQDDNWVVQAAAKEALEKILKYNHYTGDLVFKHKGHKV